MATIYIDGVKSKRMAIGTTEIANILKGTSDPSSSIGGDGQLYLKYGSYEKHYFMDNKIVVVENKNDATDLKLYIVGLTKDSSGIAITDTDLLAYLSDITSGYLKACCTYDTADSTTQTGLLAIGDWGDGMTLHTYIPGWTQYKAGTFYGVLDLTESPVSTQGFPVYQENPFVNPDAFTDGGILDSFAKVNNLWQNLMGTNIDDILAGGSKYIKATGSFTSGTASQQKVEVDCGFKPDLVMVDMEFGNGFTRATYLSTAWYEETDHPASVWDLRPMESVIYAITPESVEGETGITDLTDTGFKYRVNGGNTQGKACTYTAIKFDVKEAPEPIVPFEKEILHSIVQDQSGRSVPVSVTFTNDYQIAFICGLIADNVYTGAISVNALGGASEIYGLSGNRYASAGIAIRLPSNKTLIGYFPYSDGGAYYDMFGAIGMSRLPSEYEIGATIDVSNISIELSKVYDHIVVFVGMDSTDSNSITLAMNGTSIPLTVESDKFSRYSYHASQELTSDSTTLNFTYSGGTVADNTIVVFAYNE